MKPAELATLLEMIEKRLNCPLASSLGRIFDAAASMLGLVERVSYEGEGPTRLEGLALGEPGAGEPLEPSPALASLVPLAAGSDGEPFLLDPAPLLRELAQAALLGLEPPGALALKFHRAVAMASLAGARELRRRTGQNRVVLSGGVFQNVLLLDLLLPALKKERFEIYTHRLLPPGDGAISVGQVYFQGDSS